MSKVQGQFTIIDYNDALTLTGYIGSNLAKTQMYNPDNDSYSPDWTSKNLVLTPSLYVIGTTTDQITSSAVTSVKWYIGSSTTAITSSGSYALSGAKSHILTVKGNVMAGLPGIDYRCVVTYKDASTGLSITHPLTISFSRVVNGSGIVDLLVTTPSGNVFKNSEVASLTARRNCGADLRWMQLKYPTNGRPWTHPSHRPPPQVMMLISVLAGGNCLIPQADILEPPPIPSQSTPPQWTVMPCSNAVRRIQIPLLLLTTQSFLMLQPSLTTPTRFRLLSLPQAVMCLKTAKAQQC